MQSLIKILLFLQFQTTWAEINKFELQDYPRSIKPIDRNLAAALGTHRESIDSLSARLNQFQEKFNRFGLDKDLSKSLSILKVEGEYNEPNGILSSETSLKSTGTSKFETNNQFLSNELTGLRKIGFYVLPFIALQSPGNFWSSELDQLIEQDIGFSSGWRVGVESPHFFIEGEFSYSRNKLKNQLIRPGNNPNYSAKTTFSDYSEGFGFLLNVGGRFSLADRISVMIGAGFGTINQEIGFVIYPRAGVFVFNEEDTLFTYQVFSGLNYDFSEHFRMGLRYRWMKVGEMKLFSNRQLHLAEISMGYIF
jgi:opacity protein-like surface antigen